MSLLLPLTCSDLLAKFRPEKTIEYRHRASGLFSDRRCLAPTHPMTLNYRRQLYNIVVS